MTRRCVDLDVDTVHQLRSVHSAYLRFVQLGPHLSPRELRHAYGLFLQSSFGDYTQQAIHTLCVKSKCLNLNLLSPEPYFSDWSELQGMDSDVASERFNEYMSIKDMEYSNERIQRRSGVRHQKSVSAF